MKITEIKKDLFSMDSEYVLVHCISEDCAMGKGIAKTFDEKFKGMKKDIQDTLKFNDLHYPLSIMWGVDQPQDIMNMITKEKYWHKPTYESFEKALDDVVIMCERYGITKLAMPKIGCGLDKLQWGKVKKIIEDKFEATDIEIVVCYI